MTHTRTRLIYLGTAAFLIIMAGAIIAYLLVAGNRVSIDTASIEAPLISLSPTIPGRLDAVYVQVGQTVAANTPIAEVGSNVITSKVRGTIVQVNDTIGAQVTPASPVAQMVDPSQLRVVGKIDENKGFSQIHVGDPVTFTVDAFGSQTFTGVIDEVAPTSNQSGIVFNISSQRQVQQFTVKARFDTSTYPQLVNGMSARMSIYTK